MLLEQRRCHEQTPKYIEIDLGADNSRRRSHDDDSALHDPNTA